MSTNASCLSFLVFCKKKSNTKSQKSLNKSQNVKSLDISFQRPKRLSSVMLGSTSSQNLREKSSFNRSSIAIRNGHTFKVQDRQVRRSDANLSTSIISGIYSRRNSKSFIIADNDPIISDQTFHDFFDVKPIEKPANNFQSKIVNAKIQIPFVNKSQKLLPKLIPITPRSFLKPRFDPPNLAHKYQRSIPSSCVNEPVNKIFK